MTDDDQTYPSRAIGARMKFLTIDTYYLDQVDHDKLTLSHFKSFIFLKSKMTVQSISSIQDHHSVLVAGLPNQI